MAKGQQQNTSENEEFTEYNEYEDFELDESDEDVFFEKIPSKKRIKENMRRNARRKVEDYLESKASRKKDWNYDDEDEFFH